MKTLKNTINTLILGAVVVSLLGAFNLSVHASEDSSPVVITDPQKIQDVLIVTDSLREILSAKQLAEGSFTVEEIRVLNADSENVSRYPKYCNVDLDVKILFEKGNYPEETIKDFSAKAVTNNDGCMLFK